MRKILSIVLVMVFLASAVSLAITPAAATYPYEKKIPGDADEDDELTKDELVNAILPYMLDEGNLALDDVGDAAWVYAYWDGKPMTVVDQVDRRVTFYRPVERVVSTSWDSIRLVVALGEFNKFVGTSYKPFGLTYYPEYSMPEEDKSFGEEIVKLPYTDSKNLELIVTLKPDVVFGSSRTADAMQEQTGIPVVAAGSAFTFEEVYEPIRIVGTLFKKENEAEELISLIEEKIDKVREVTSQIPDDEKPKVYIGTRATSTGYDGLLKTVGYYEPLDIAGGINVADEISAGTSATITKEQLIAWNPDIIFVTRGSLNDKSVRSVEAVLSDPELQTINAVKNCSVYHTTQLYCYGRPHCRNIVNTMYMAKIFHPEKFKDLDLEKEGNEISKAFYKENDLYTELADWTVWLREFIENPPEERKW